MHRRPTLIVCKTAIGKGAPTRAGTAKAHGEPLGTDEIAATRAGARLARTRRSRFPTTSRANGMRAAPAPSCNTTGMRASTATAPTYPDAGAEFVRRLAGELPGDFDAIAARR